jgi:Fic-DOC domain mobile mystery protein B
MKFNYPYGATPINEDEASDLIPTHIIFAEELNEYEEQNIIKASIKYFPKHYQYDEILIFDFLLRVHKDMFNETWKWAGKIRKSMKNIGVDISQIYEQTKNLCKDVKYWIENNTYSFDEIGVRFHHRLVQIHLFPNGNGRHARFITDLLLKNTGNLVFTWGSKDLYHKSEARTNYINALHKADVNDYIPLLKFVRT